jgi:ABC-type Fe3+-hydroxamate transport system substrate-binding protein
VLLYGRATRSYAWRGAALALAATFLACSAAEDSAPGSGTLDASPRVVSLSPVASELVLALGAGDRLVGTDAASRQLPGLSGLPSVALGSVTDLQPDLLLTPAPHGADARRVRALRERGVTVLEFSPHDFEDAFALCRELGTHLGRRAEVEVFVRDQSRPLALISSTSMGQRRPRVAAVVGLDPLEVAGGHSFTTDLIEIAGAESVTHGIHAPRIAMSASELLERAPELVLVIGQESPSERERDVARSALRGASEIVFFTLDAERFWLQDPVEAARRLRALIEPLSRAIP